MAIPQSLKETQREYEQQVVEASKNNDPAAWWSNMAKWWSLQGQWATWPHHQFAFKMSDICEKNAENGTPIPAKE